MGVRSGLEKPPHARGAGAPSVKGPPKYRILKFVMGSFGHDSIILTEGSIHRDLRGIGLIIRGAPIIEKGAGLYATGLHPIPRSIIIRVCRTLV